MLRARDYLSDEDRSNPTLSYQVRPQTGYAEKNYNLDAKQYVNLTAHANSLPTEHADKKFHTEKSFPRTLNQI